MIAEVRRLAPEVVARRVRLELAKLGPEATRLAEAVAVLGDDVELVHAAALAALDVERAQEAAGRVVRAEFLGREPLLRFVHPLLRTAVYQELVPGARDLAHGCRAAAVLADTGAAIERVAAQLVAAPPGGRPEVVETLREAARRALSDGAPESASAYLRRALAEPPPAADRAGVLLEHKTKSGPPRNGRS